MDETFLTTEEVLEYLQVNLRTVYRLIKAGKIPAVRVGRQWRFRKSDIDTWLDHQRAGLGTRRTEDWPTTPPPSPGSIIVAPAPVLPSGSKPRVLVVDDEESIRDLLFKALSLADYEVEVTFDGPSALEKLRHNTYDLLIAD